MQIVERIEVWTNDQWTSYLKGQGWISECSAVHSVSRLPGGNMNLSLKLHHSEGTLFLKQGRPWVEKFPEYAAPWGRTELEAEFYSSTKAISEISRRMPRFIGIDTKHQILATEFFEAATDLGVIYRDRSGSQFCREQSRPLLEYLEALSRVDLSKISQNFSGNDLLPLNAFHIYDFPFLEAQVLAAEEIGGESLEWLRSKEFLTVRDQLKGDYFSTGSTLLHGDFYPGSFLLASDGLKVIDPEFCFLGRSEFDAGNLYGHLILAGAEGTAIELEWNSSAFFRSLDLPYLKKVAGIEILRRLLGVAKVHDSVKPAEITLWIETARSYLLK